MFLCTLAQLLGWWHEANKVNLVVSEILANVAQVKSAELKAILTQLAELTKLQDQSEDESLGFEF